MAALGDQVAGAAIGAQVRDFYERHPYPPPVDGSDGIRPRLARPAPPRRPISSGRSEPYRDDRSILVAGCGTSQAAKYALRWPEAQVTGHRLQRDQHRRNRRAEAQARPPQPRGAPAAGRARRRAGAKLRSDRLHRRSASSWPTRTPGLRALRDVLAPDGAMHLMVYAPYGRTGIYMLQEFCRRLGIGATTSRDPRSCRRLSALPPDHPLMPLLRKAPDFRNEAGLADALLHPQDRAYSVPQLFDFLAAADLEFGRWLRQAPYLPNCGALVQSPHAENFKRLSPAEQFAAIELFRGTMVVAQPRGISVRPTTTSGHQFRRRRVARLCTDPACPTLSSWRSDCRQRLRPS